MQPPEAVAAWRPAIDDIASTLGFALPEPQRETLLAYLTLLQRWNATYNLTSVRDPVQMLTQHVADCLAVIPPLRRHLGPSTSPRLLDVGSGAGLPGLVIAATNPTFAVTCVDTVGKKAAFLLQAAGELGLRNLHAEHARVEQLKAPQFDVITSRAFASLVDFVRLTRNHLKPKGVWMAMKGKAPSEEIAALPVELEVFHVELLHIPGLDAERCLVWMRVRA